MVPHRQRHERATRTLDWLCANESAPIASTARRRDNAQHSGSYAKPDKFHVSVIYSITIPFCEPKFGLKTANIP